MECACVRKGACARALPRPSSARPPQLPKGQTWSPRPARALRRSTPITACTRTAPRTQRPQTPARPCGHVLRDAAPCECRREDGCNDTVRRLRARESNDEHHSTMRAAPAAAIDRGMPCALTPACIGACGRRRRGPFCGGGLLHFQHHPTVPTPHVAPTPRLKRTRRLSPNRTSTGHVTSACHYEHARMRTPRWKMPCSARKAAALRVHAESVGGGASHRTRGPPAAGVGRRGASRVAAALSRFLRRRNRYCCPSVATAHRVLQRRIT
jgi:hypothetical protein